MSRIPAILGICVMLGMFYCAWWWATASQEDKIALFGASEAPEDPYAANLTVKQMLREVVAASCEVALACNARGFKKAFPGGLEQCQQQPLPKLPASAQDVDFDAHVRCDNVGLDQCLSSLANRSCKTAPDAGMPDACVKCLATVPNKQR